MTQVIVIPSPLNEQVDVVDDNGNRITGTKLSIPANSFAYNLDKTEHIKSVLGVDGLSQYLMEVSEIIM